MVSWLAGSLCFVLRMCHESDGELSRRDRAPLKNLGSAISMRSINVSNSSVRPTKKYLLARLNFACSKAQRLPAGSQHLLKCPQNQGTWKELTKVD